MLYLASFILAILSIAGCGQTSMPIPSSLNPQLESKIKSIEPLGIETIAMHYTAAGNMLDFRFRVLDPEKSMPLFREDIYPYLIHEKTGVSLKVTDTTKVGPMRPTSRNPKAGKAYFMLFKNPNKFIKIGDKITVVVGEQRIENLVVQ